MRSEKKYVSALELMIKDGHISLMEELSNYLSRSGKTIVMESAINSAFESIISDYIEWLPYTDNVIKALNHFYKSISNLVFREAKLLPDGKKIPLIEFTLKMATEPNFNDKYDLTSDFFMHIASFLARHHLTNYFHELADKSSSIPSCLAKVDLLGDCCCSFIMAITNLSTTEHDIAKKEWLYKSLTQFISVINSVCERFLALPNIPTTPRLRERLNNNINKLIVILVIHPELISKLSTDDPSLPAEIKEVFSTLFANKVSMRRDQCQLLIAKSLLTALLQKGSEPNDDIEKSVLFLLRKYTDNIIAIDKEHCGIDTYPAQKDFMPIFALIANSPYKDKAISYLKEIDFNKRMEFIHGLLIFSTMEAALPEDIAANKPAARELYADILKEMLTTGELLEGDDCTYTEKLVLLIHKNILDTNDISVVEAANAAFEDDDKSTLQHEIAAYTLLNYFKLAEAPISTELIDSFKINLVKLLKVYDGSSVIQSSASVTKADLVAFALKSKDTETIELVLNNFDVEHFELNTAESRKTNLLTSLLIDTDIITPTKTKALEIIIERISNELRKYRRGGAAAAAADVPDPAKLSGLLRILKDSLSTLEEEKPENFLTILENIVAPLTATITNIDDLEIDSELKESANEIFASIVSLILSQEDNVDRIVIESLCPLLSGHTQNIAINKVLDSDGLINALGRGAALAVIDSIATSIITFPRISEISGTLISDPKYSEKIEQLKKLSELISSREGILLNSFNPEGVEPCYIRILSFISNLDKDVLNDPTIPYKDIFANIITKLADAAWNSHECASIALESLETCLRCNEIDLARVLCVATNFGDKATVGEIIFNRLPIILNDQLTRLSFDTFDEEQIKAIFPLIEAVNDFSTRTAAEVSNTSEIKVKLFRSLLNCKDLKVTEAIFGDDFPGFKLTPMEFFRQEEPAASLFEVTLDFLNRAKREAHGDNKLTLALTSLLRAMVINYLAEPDHHIDEIANIINENFDELFCNAKANSAEGLLLDSSSFILLGESDYFLDHLFIHDDIPDAISTGLINKLSFRAISALSTGDNNQFVLALNNNRYNSAACIVSRAATDHITGLGIDDTINSIVEGGETHLLTKLRFFKLLAYNFPESEPDQPRPLMQLLSCNVPRLNKNMVKIILDTARTTTPAVAAAAAGGGNAIETDPTKLKLMLSEIFVADPSAISIDAVANPIVSEMLIKAIKDNDDILIKALATNDEIFLNPDVDFSSIEPGSIIPSYRATMAISENLTAVANIPQPDIIKSLLCALDGDEWSTRPDVDKVRLLEACGEAARKITDSFQSAVISRLVDNKFTNLGLEHTHLDAAAKAARSRPRM